MSSLAVAGRPACVRLPRSQASGHRLRRLLILVLLLITAVAVISGTVARASSGGPVGPRTITVQSGDTLSHIAVRELPDLPMGTAVAEIQLANRLNTSHVHAGQRLVIPPAG